MAGMDRSELFSRLRELRSQQGKGWKDIARIVEEEGYREKGKALSDNALRKRYTRWIKKEEGTHDEPLVVSEPETEGFLIDSSKGSHRDRYGRQLDEYEFGIPASKIASSLASLVSLNNQLLEQLREFNVRIGRLERDIEEQKSKTSHTGIDAEEHSVTSRDLLELLKDITSRREQQMQYVEENKEYLLSREDIVTLLEEKVQEKVDYELKTILAEGGSFSAQLTRLVDQRLKNLFSPAEPVVRSAPAGPGRGRKGKTHKKFSASLEEGLFERVKSLPGQFSGHLSNALEAYLSVMDGQECQKD